MSNDPVQRHSFKTLDKLVDFEKHLKIYEQYFEFVSIISIIVVLSLKAISHFSRFLSFVQLQMMPYFDGKCCHPLLGQGVDT